MSNSPTRSGRNNDFAYWLIAVLLLTTGIAAPIGFLMIVFRLLGGTRRGTKRGRHPYYTQQSENSPAGARTTAPAAETGDAAPKKKKENRKTAASSILTEMAASGKKLTRIGGILSGIFACVTIVNAVDNLWMLPDIAWYLEEIIPLVCITAGGLGCLWAGLRKNKQVRQYRSYLAVIGNQASVSVPDLASASGVSARRVRDDLDDMLGDGFFPNGFLDYGNDRLILSPEGRKTPPKEPPAPAKDEPDQEDSILAEIKAVNDAIDNEKLSGQIDRIGVITAKILDYQKSHPERSPQLHSFLSYYLPTTLKILRAYGQLEDQDVSGENISAAMTRIEGMMDKVVEGFEKQLDQLFQGDAMDITTDVEVLERMLAKDGLSDRQGMTLNF